ncbi:MAG: tetratricopeptide repeat protein, partial [Candidatus Nitrosocaldus sp.]
NNKGVALYRLKRFDDAIRCFDKALRINPRDVKVWRNKGNALVELGMLNEAVKCFNKVIEIDANSSSRMVEV